jgi:DNA polymerase IV (DinB-like DNA polymerase)
LKCPKNCKRSLELGLTVFLCVVGCEAKVRVILHVDMDSFFSAIEVREHPELKGRPVVVGGRISPNATEEGARKIRGVVSTCSYEARAFGIHSAMPLSRAYQLCPDAAFLPVNMALYKRVSAELMAILRQYADKFEQVSIDEAYLDIGTLVRDWGEASAYAQRIKAEIREKAGLSCSIGLAPNKIVAKIASDFQKPDGLTVVEPKNIEAFLAPLPAKRIPGVGPKTEAALKALGIERIEQLARTDVQNLIDRFGKYGWWLHQVANGIDERELVEKWERKSLSRETTLAENTRDQTVINRCIDELAASVHAHLQREGLVFKTAAIKLKFDDFAVRTRARTLTSFHADLPTIGKTAKVLLKQLISETAEERQIRLVGVRVSTLAVVDEKQRRLV